MLRTFSSELIKDFFMEVSVASVEQNNRIGKTFSMNCLIKIIFPKEIVDQIKLAEESKNIQKKIDTYDYLIQTYAIMTTDVAFFNTIWRGNNTVTCRYIIEMKSGETMKIGPFKHIDLVRDFK